MKFLADEDFNNRIINGFRLHLPEMDIVRVQDTEAYQQEDEVLFAVSIGTGRILLTHDVSTMPLQIEAHLMEETNFPGVIFVPQFLSIGVVIEQMAYIFGAGTEDDFWNAYTYLPL